MSSTPDFRRLRTYLMAYFIPLTGVPLLILALIAYFLVSEAVDREIAKRAGPELSAIARNLDTMERKLEKYLIDLSRRDSLRGALERGDMGEISRDFKAQVAGMAFERVRLFALDGRLLSDVSSRDSKKINEVWSTLFAPRAAISPSEKNVFHEQPFSSRMPAANASIATFVNSSSRMHDGGGSRLHPDFMKFLRAESAISLREVDQTSGDSKALEFLQYRVVLDPDFRPIAFVEARLSLEASRLKILSDYQGVDLIVLDTQMTQLGASSAEVAANARDIMPQVKALANKEQTLKNASFDLKYSGDPVKFFFTPVSNEAFFDNTPAAWIAVGLNKRDQIQLRNQVILWISLLAIGLAGIVVLITVRLSERITKPVSDLVRATEAMKLGEWVHPVDADSKTEIGVLVRRFNEMAQSVQVTKRMLELKLEELATAHGELTKTQGQLVQSAKMSSLGQLVAGVAHELNNPIAFIYSNMTQMRLYLKNLERLDSLVKNFDKGLNSEESKKLHLALDDIEWDYVRKDMADMVQSCLEGSIRVKDIVIGLRNFSRLDKGEVGDLDVNHSLTNTAKLLNSQIKNRIEIHWELCEDGRLRANPSQINQVFMNILANGLQAIEGRGDVWIKTWSTQEDDIEYLSISIRDSGKGIRQEHIDKIFDPFFTTKKVGEGTGLGLSIVYGIIERHRGTIQVRSLRESDAGHGTEFLIRLPRWGTPINSQSDESAA